MTGSATAPGRRLPPSDWRLEDVACPLCGSRDARRIGVRGNREHNGADPRAEPHVWTYAVRCRGCDLVYTNPMIRGWEHLEEAYYGDAERYAATAEQDPAGMFGDRLRLLERYAEPGRLLDVGAGKGEFLAEARRRGWGIDGVEPSTSFCESAKKHLGVEIRQGFLGQVAGIPESSFDVVTLNHVLEHVERPVDLLQLCRRYAKPRGWLFVEVPNGDSNLARVADLYFRLRGRRWSTRVSPMHPPFHRVAYTRASLRFALAQAGWDLIAMKTYSGRDRGYRDANGRSAPAMARNVAEPVLSLFGNRELLAAVASRSAASGRNVQVRAGATPGRVSEV